MLKQVNGASMRRLFLTGPDYSQLLTKFRVDSRAKLVGSFYTWITTFWASKVVKKLIFHISDPYKRDRLHITQIPLSWSIAKCAEFWLEQQRIVSVLPSSVMMLTNYRNILTRLISVLPSMSGRSQDSLFAHIE
jgi:hypothetical protein